VTFEAAPSERDGALSMGIVFSRSKAVASAFEIVLGIRRENLHDR
jgi:hypothetical protein